MVLDFLRVKLFQPRVLSILRRYTTQTPLRPIPEPRGNIKTPHDFLAAIGRSCETKLQVDRWENLWSMRGKQMKKAGLDVKDRRYILWCLNKFRLGHSPIDFIYSEKPKKKIRGWGPKVQSGKRIRSRRYR